MDANNKSTPGAAPWVRRPRRLWRWFVGGFLLVFVGMLLLVRMIVMHPSGQYLVQYPLWQYYADGLPRLFGSSTLGPTSGANSALMETVLFHVLFSLLGGGAATAVGWRVHSLLSRRAAEAGAAPDRSGIT